MTDIDRRRALGIGGAALLTALAGCSLFDDTTGVPGREGETANSETQDGDVPEETESAFDSAE